MRNVTRTHREVRNLGVDMQSGAVQQGVGLWCYWFVSFRERLMSAARLRSCCSVPCDLVSSLRRWFP